MKRSPLLSMLLALVILASSSCGGTKNDISVPSEKLSQKTEGKIDSTGVITEDIILAVSDNSFAVYIAAGTKALDKKGKPIEKITMNPPDKTPSPPDNIRNIAVVDLGPDGATFDKPVVITLSYNPENLPENTSPHDLVIAYYDEDAKEWVELTEIVVDTVNRTVTGKTKHFTIFAIQIKEPVVSENSAVVSREPYYILSSLSLRLQELIGNKAWVIGYYGDSSFASDGVAFLVEDYTDLLTERQLAQHTFARLDGKLPPEELDGKMLLIYGEIKEYGEEHNAFVIFPTPLITVEEYLIFDDISEFPDEDNPWQDFTTIGDKDTDETSLVGITQAESYSKFSSITASEKEGDLSRFRDNLGEPPPTQASDCDRVLVICGGIDENNYQPRYKYNTGQRYGKLKELGFSDGQIDILQYDGSAININGTNIVDGSATMANIRAAIKKYKDEMPASCTLLVFVDDHGTGYETGDAWNGEFPALGAGTETGITYPENSIPVDLRRYIYRDTSVLGTPNGDSWIITTHVSSNTSRIWRKQGDSYVYAGRDTNGDGWITEDEVNTGDFDGDGTANEDDYGFNLSNAGIHWDSPRGIEKTWDTDRDGNPDMRARWVNPPGRFHFERKVGNEWKKMAEDTNGDFIINAGDGGINWDLSNDGASGQIGFHEGINLFGREVLWDYQFAEMLGSLSDKGVHVLVTMQQCFSGGLVQNLTGVVEKVCASSAEDKTTIVRPTDAATKTVTNQTHLNYYGYGFVNSLKGIDISSWNKAHQGAHVTDSTRRAAYNGTANHYQVWEVTDFKTSTTYEKHDDGMYTIALRIPQGDNVYDFEIIMGLQQPRWNISLDEGIGFPEGLPEGLDSELIPGGIRVFSSSPFGVDPFLVRMRALEGTEITRINFTDASHNTIGYTTPGVEVIPDTNPLEVDVTVDVSENNNPETCECTGSVSIQVEAYDPYVPDTVGSGPDAGCRITSVEIYVDDELIQTTRYQENSPDPALEASWNAAVIATKDISAGTHTARVVVTNWYGHEIVREQEFVICEGLGDIIPASQTNKITMLASAPVQIQGYAPDCTATMEVTWSATAMQESGITLRAAWLRINGQEVASSKPPGVTAPPSGYNFDLPAVSTEGSGDGTTLGGLYTCAVEPGSTVTVDIVVFGSDCRYYMAAWEKYVPGCPVPYTPPPTPPCFSADTLVVASDGSLVRIDEIQVGDMVKAYNTDSGEIVVREVTAINSGQADYYYTINGNLKVTPPHPFYLVEEGWIPVENLKVGDRIRSIDGVTVITSIELVYEEQSIFNIGVTGGNFFVSPDGLEFYLVHQGE